MPTTLLLAMLLLLLAVSCDAISLLPAARLLVLLLFMPVLVLLLVPNIGLTVIFAGATANPSAICCISHMLKAPPLAWIPPTAPNPCCCCKCLAAKA
jgi:hypothetical protein